MNNEWVLATYGGLAIGLSASVLLWGLGRIAGVSGILSRAMFSGKQTFLAEHSWRWLFLAGLLLGGVIAHWGFHIPVPEMVPENTFRIVLAGLMVGYGVSIGSGCTSGHGICGLARFSRRSLVATASFMLAGIVTVFVTRHIF